ncbi:hypothetical protein C2E23DRAFT_400918 [Lenzites betulinus]|nr:hypothetical protein C2E23DRAFT_400918 [Lenzites betulinus]
MRTSPASSSSRRALIFAMCLLLTHAAGAHRKRGDILDTPHGRSGQDPIVSICWRSILGALGRWRFQARVEFRLRTESTEDNRIRIPPTLKGQRAMIYHTTDGRGDLPFSPFY